MRGASFIRMQENSASPTVIWSLPRDSCGKI